MRDFTLKIAVKIGTTIKTIEYKCCTHSLADAIALAEREEGYVRILEVIKC